LTGQNTNVEKKKTVEVDYNKAAKDKGVTFSDFTGYNNDIVTTVLFSVGKICYTTDKDKEDQDRGQSMKKM
jgi:hypothetical protein